MLVAWLVSEQLLEPSIEVGSELGRDPQLDIAAPAGAADAEPAYVT